jgi:hypothetical protein
MCSVEVALQISKKHLLKSLDLFASCAFASDVPIRKIIIRATLYREEAWRAVRKGKDDTNLFNFAKLGKYRLQIRFTSVVG